MANCLLCGAGVWYVGLFNADCTNSGCTNYREPPPKKPELEYGSWVWALKAQKEHWRLEFCKPTNSPHWYPLTGVLDGTVRPEYEFRINQEIYAPRSEHKHGTQEWAEDMMRKGCKVRIARDGYEVIP